jgi:hypothetical protein
MKQSAKALETKDLPKDRVKFTPGKEEIPLKGRIYDLREFFLRKNLTIDSSLEEISMSIAEATSDERDGTQYPSVSEIGGGYCSPCSCNGPHHALIVANFAQITAAAMLQNRTTKEIIDGEINQLSSVGQVFFKGEGASLNYANYLKLVGIMALLHDSARPADGIDQWDSSNEHNVEINLPYFFKGLPEVDVPKVLGFIKMELPVKISLHVQSI